MMTLRETRTVRAGIEVDTAFGAVVPPLYLSSNFTFAGFENKRAYDYTRSGNPTRDLLAGALAALEGARGAVVTSSGMAAVWLVLQLVEPGGLVVAPRDCYGGTFRLLEALAERGQLALRFADLQDPDALDGLEPALVWIETPSNPLMRVTDIAAVAGRAKRRGALVCVDNTFLSPALQRPLELGADLAVHSTTKYLNGHSDVVGGAVCARSDVLAERLGWWANCAGLTGAPFDSWLTLRGLRTLHARMRLHGDNAAAIAALCAGHPAVARVHYPGLGGMLSLELIDVPDAVPRFIESLGCFSLAESLGGVESLVAHPASMTHAAMPAEARERAGIGERLLRISVGIEAKEDLLADVERALALVLPRGAGATATSDGEEERAP